MPNEGPQSVASWLSRYAGPAFVAAAAATAVIPCYLAGRTEMERAEALTARLAVAAIPLPGEGKSATKRRVLALEAQRARAHRHVARFRNTMGLCILLGGGGAAALSFLRPGPKSMRTTPPRMCPPTTPAVPGPPSREPAHHSRLVDAPPVVGPPLDARGFARCHPAAFVSASRNSGQ